MEEEEEDQKEQKLKMYYFKNQNEYEEQIFGCVISLKGCTELVDSTQYFALRCECTKQSFKVLLCKAFFYCGYEQLTSGR